MLSSEIAREESTFRFEWSEKVPFDSADTLSQKRFSFRDFQNCFIALMLLSVRHARCVLVHAAFILMLASFVLTLANLVLTLANLVLDLREPRFGPREPRFGLRERRFHLRALPFDPRALHFGVRVVSSRPMPDPFDRCICC